MFSERRDWRGCYGFRDEPEQACPHNEPFPALGRGKRRLPRGLKKRAAAATLAFCMLFNGAVQTLCATELDSGSMAGDGLLGTSTTIVSGAVQETPQQLWVATPSDAERGDGGNGITADNAMGPESKEQYKEHTDSAYITETGIGGLCIHHPTHTAECRGLTGTSPATPSNASRADLLWTKSEDDEDEYFPDIVIGPEGSELAQKPIDSVYIAGMDEENNLQDAASGQQAISGKLTLVSGRQRAIAGSGSDTDENDRICHFVCPICNPELAAAISANDVEIDIPEGTHTVFEGETIDLLKHVTAEPQSADADVLEEASISEMDLQDTDSGYETYVYSVATEPDPESGMAASSSPEAWDYEDNILTPKEEDGAYRVVYVAADQEGRVVAAQEAIMRIALGDRPSTTLECRLKGNIFSDTTYEVSKYVLADPHTVEYLGKKYEVEVKVSDVKDCNGYPLQVPFTDNDGKFLTPVHSHAQNSPFTITFQPYITLEDGSVVTLDGELEVILSVASKGEVMPLLDRDDAYVSVVGMGNASNTAEDNGITDGTLPFDTEAGPGNDGPASEGADHNKVVRTFDTIVYQTAFKTQIHENSYNAGYEKGRMYFEYVFPGLTADQIMFEESSMAWLTSEVAESAYRIEQLDGDTVMRGSFLLITSTPKISVIGAAEDTRSIVVRVLRMKNGDTIQPSVTYWMDQNDVGAEYDDEDPRYLKEGSPLVQKTGHVCKTHGIKEYSTQQAVAVTVSAVPAYNIQIGLGLPGDNQAVGTFDFTDTTGGLSSGFDGKPFGSSVEGRLNGYGVTLQLTHGKDSGKGMRGIEVPEDGSTIEFDIYLSCGYTTTSGKTVSAEENTEYRPQIWAAGPCEEGSPPDQRPLPNNVYGRIAGAAPFNSGGGYNGCFDGGDWTFTNSPTDPQAIHVKVSNFRVDLTQLPSAYASSTEGQSVYYDPSMKASYWNIETACIGAGELWILQPFISTVTGERINIAENSNVNTTTYVEHRPTTVTVTDPSGNKKTYTDSVIGGNDDKTTLTESLTNPGTIDGCLAYLRAPHAQYNDSLTENCYINNFDWGVKNQTIDIVRSLGHTNAEGDYMGTAYDLVAKFDDRFFEIDPDYYEAQKPSSWVYYSPNGFKVLYGAYRNTASGSWHEDGYTGKTSDPGYDDAMRNAMPEDLLWFTSIDELKKSGKEKCCAIMFQFRGIHDVAGNFDTYFRGRIMDTAEAGGVYMICNSSYVWTKDCVKEDVKKSYGLNTDPTDEQYNNYICNPENFHSWELINDKTPEEIREELPDFYWMEGEDPDKYNDKFFYDTQSYDADVPAYKKAQYADDGALVSAGEFSFSGGDSCLVLSYATKVGVSTLPAGRSDALDVDNGMRYVDFEVIPDAVAVEGVIDGGEYGGTMKNVVLTVQLPEGLTFLPETAFLGGTYIEGDVTSHGTVQGGLRLTDLDGTGYHYHYDEATRTLTIEIDEVRMSKDGHPMEGELPHLYFSALVGTPGIMETDVKSGQSFSVSAKIQSDDDKWRHDPNSQGRQATAGFTVYKGFGNRLYKAADQLVVESGEPMSFSMSVENRSTDEDMEEKFVIDNLPYNGDGRQTSVTGNIYVTEFSAGGVPERLEKLKTIQFYYTTDPSIRDKDSQSFEDNYDPASDGSVWHRLTFTEDTETTEGVTRLIMSGLPSKESQATAPVTAIAAYGSIPTETSLSMHVKLEVPNGLPGDRLNNKLSMDATEAKSAGGFSYVVSRKISGCTWLDDDQDGIRQDDEALLPNVKVTLLKNGTPMQYKGTDGNMHDATVLSGQGTLDFITGEITRDSGNAATAEAEYGFLNVPTGTYSIRFESSDTVNLSDYIASGVKQGDSYKKDSDAVPVYNDSRLVSSMISDIYMPKAEELSSDLYHDICEDAGFHGVDLVISKTVKADAEAEASLKTHNFRFDVSFNGAGANGKYRCEISNGSELEADFTDGTFSLDLKAGETAVIKGLPAGAEVKVRELQAFANLKGRNRQTEYHVDEGGSIAGMDVSVTLPTADPAGDGTERYEKKVAYTNTYHAPKLEITKAQSLSGGAFGTDPLDVVPGDVITYELTVKNVGTEDAVGVVVTDRIPEATVQVSGAGATVQTDRVTLEFIPGSAGTGSYGNNVASWNIGTIPAGESRTVRFSVTVPKVRGKASWKNIAHVSFENDPAAEDNGGIPPQYPSNEVEARSERTMADITIHKRINEVYGPYGDPAFLFVITNSFTGKSYVRMVKLSETQLDGSFTVEVPWGFEYTVRELVSSRYLLHEISNVENITDTDIDAGTATADLTSQTHAEAEYYNVITQYEKLSHSDSVVNSIPRSTASGA